MNQKIRIMNIINHNSSICQKHCSVSFMNTTVWMYFTEMIKLINIQLNQKLWGYSYLVNDNIRNRHLKIVFETLLWVSNVPISFHLCIILVQSTTVSYPDSHNGLIPHWLLPPTSHSVHCSKNNSCLYVCLFLDPKYQEFGYSYFLTHDMLSSSVYAIFFSYFIT